MSSTGIKAVVFDFDGLILDTETPEVEGWEREFARHGLAIPDGWWAGLTGRGPEEVLEWPQDLLERLLGWEVDHGETLARVNEIRLAGINSAPLLPGVAKVIAEAGRLGMKLGIASSSQHDWVEGHLAKHMPVSTFEAIVCRGDAPRAKPEPDLYLLACSRLGVPTSEALALEDSPNGIAAAKAAGMWCVAVPNSVTAKLDLSRADVVLGSLDELELGAWVLGG